MSIPRVAIERPVMMSMISAIIILLGVISLTRLPVDLLPDISQPTISVRVNYTGVGPLEMEELVTRPLEQQLSAVSGLQQMNSTSSEGNSQIQLNFTWGHDLNEAMDDIRTRIDRVRGELALRVAHKEPIDEAPFLLAQRRLDDGAGKLGRGEARQRLDGRQLVLMHDRCRVRPVGDAGIGGDGGRQESGDGNEGKNDSAHERNVVEHWRTLSDARLNSS